MRAAWVVAHGPIDNRDVCVCHRCDNRKCVRLSHLFLASREENNADRDAKGRTARGDRSGRRLHPERWTGLLRGVQQPLAKLDDEKVREIRALYARGHIRQRDIAARFGVTQATVNRVLLGHIWRHVV